MGDDDSEIDYDYNDDENDNMLVMMMMMMLKLYDEDNDNDIVVDDDDDDIHRLNFFLGFSSPVIQHVNNDTYHPLSNENNICAHDGDDRSIDGKLDAVLDKKYDVVVNDHDEHHQQHHEYKQHYEQAQQQQQQHHQQQHHEYKQQQHHHEHQQSGIVFPSNIFDHLSQYSINYILNQLQLYSNYYSRDDDDHNHHRAIIHDHQIINHPSCFTYSNKPNIIKNYHIPSSINDDHHEFHQQQQHREHHNIKNNHNDYKTDNVILKVIKNVGRGSFGHAILMKMMNYSDDIICTEQVYDDRNNIHEIVYHHRHIHYKHIHNHHHYIIVIIIIIITNIIVIIIKNNITIKVLIFSSSISPSLSSSSFILASF